MNILTKRNLSLSIWMIALIGIGSIIGAFITTDIHSWYTTLHRSPLTPPNYAFPIIWTLLYALLGICGWQLWQQPASQQLTTIKTLYATQLLLNWSWTPLFFHYHLIGTALSSIILMTILTALIAYMNYRTAPIISILMMPYSAWLLFATYLNAYIWLYN